MRVKIETTIEIPDEIISGFPMSREDHAKEIVRDGITSFVRLSHAEKALTFALDNHPDLAHRHNLWTDICEKLNWEMTVED